ncbi:hypothetical protein RB614_33745 [Phytohabitans sp. ZYX-F-186]|uniref:Uncharacterized protein n=1 Tax=Phytohabitans maris TaxID=3071409 RepID=A0ABU0ZR43_9ACTN|nr:hypothetical protein [Phytohabitans sp. ZYX-F-186]MDQ7909499.1 hypothetical protein [Phytohabitans sp. ZYX-F-186]
MSIESDRIGPMGDEEAALFRFLRFGRLPDRVLPAERVELVEVDPKRDVPEPVADPTGVWNFRYV